MPRYAEPVPAPSARKGAPSSALHRPPNRAGPQRSAKWHAIQLQAARSAAPAPAAKAQSGTGLPPRVKAGVERLSGIAMDDVRVHRNSSEPAKLAALAYTVGSDIHLGPGQEQHLAHEAWHVVQQKQGRVKPTVQMMGGVPVNDDAGLEREADRMGAEALRSTEAPAETAAGHELGEQDAQTHATAPAFQFTIGEQLYGALWSLGLTADGREAGQAATVGMNADYHEEDSVANVDEEPLQPGDLVLGKVGQHHQYLLGTALAEDNPEMWDQFRKRVADHTDNPTPEQFLAWYNKGPVTRSWISSLLTLQRKRGPGDSYQAAYTTSKLGPFAEVTYTRDNQGCIDFTKNTKVKPNTVWTDPVQSGSEVQLSTGSKQPTHGVGARGLIDIAQSSRAQHFWIANNLMGYNFGNDSPPNQTWHHLPVKYKMVLVDRQVHRMHGHNGGKLIW
jgi:hypothetical protein